MPEGASARPAGGIRYPAHLKMRRFWDLITRPILLERSPRRIVEIGSHTGESTRALLELCREIDAHADIIDPLPPANLSEIHGLLSAHGQYHPQLSLEALKALPAADVYLIDGDHNWYTVFHELTSIDERARAEGVRRPLMVLHDVDWPYGRRDLYYDRSKLPDEHQHEAMQGGLTPGQEEVTPGRGVNQHLFHAVHEGGLKNGVRTAIEDFVRDQPAYRFCSLPGYHGLGFVVPRQDEALPYAQMIFAFCEKNPAALTLLRRVEEERMSALAKVGGLQVALEKAQLAEREARERAQVAETEQSELERELMRIKSTRGYQALEALRNLRRRLRHR